MTNVLPIVLFSLVFFVFPWLPDVNTGAKAFFFFFFSFGAFLVQVLRGRAFHLDRACIPWLFLLLALAVSAALSRDTGSAFLWVGGFGAGFLFFLVAREFAWEHSEPTRVLVGTLLGIALFCALLGLGQFFDYVFNGPRGGMLVPYLLPGTWGIRISGPFGQPNLHALLMLVGLCAFSHLYFHDIRQDKSLWVKTGILFPGFLLWLNLFLTGSRGGQVALMAVLLAFGWSLWKFGERLWGRGRWRKCLALAVVALSALVLAKFLVAGLIDHEAMASYQAGRAWSIASRFNTWMASLLMALDHPFFGVGPDNFKAMLPAYQIQARDFLQFEYEDMLYTRWAHNEYLQILAEGGAVSFTLYCLLLYTLFSRIFKPSILSQKSEQVFLSLAVLPFFVQGVFSWPLRFPPHVALCLTLLAVLLPRDNAFKWTPGRVQRLFLALFCSAALVGGGWAFFWSCQVGFLKDRIANEELIEENFENFKTLAENPAVAFTVLNKGLTPFVNYAEKNRDQAMAAGLVPYLKKAIFLEGASWQWYNLARTHIVLMDEEQARSAVEASLDLNPVYEPSWKLLHYLNVLHVARETGRPLDSFFPEGPPSWELPDAGDSVQGSIQDL